MAAIFNEGRDFVSRIRKVYTMRLAGRIGIFLCCLLLVFRDPGEMEILQGGNFFRKPSALHLLWAIWMTDMVFQLIPVKAAIALGSHKIFLRYYKPWGKEIDRQGLKDYMAESGKGAAKVFVLWLVLTAAIGVLHRTGILEDPMLFLITAAFYVCDLVCVVIICPFRLLMGNRCCTTCRIFNWDHLMMFAPVVYIDGFYTRSLFFMALAVWIVWEMCAVRYPQRFWEGTNKALGCKECKDKLCPRYDSFILKGTKKCDINL